MAKFWRKWNKKEKEWYFYYKKIPKELEKDKDICPRCGKSISNGKVTKNNHKDIKYNQWSELELKELRNIFKITCNSCFEKIPLNDFPDNVQIFRERLILEPMKRIYGNIYNARISKTTKTEFHLSVKE
ncbi:MAG: hypothetical protein GF329_07560 [Candidatus Lokiarchaeota archaeon]|nr:hypothetical protein [Candidatus Lokiarchaeota archaeon]